MLKKIKQFALLAGLVGVFNIFAVESTLAELYIAVNKGNYESGWPVHDSSANIEIKNTLKEFEDLEKEFHKHEIESKINMGAKTAIKEILNQSDDEIFYSNEKVWIPITVGKPDLINPIDFSYGVGSGGIVFDNTDYHKILEIIKHKDFIIDNDWINSLKNQQENFSKKLFLTVVIGLRQNNQKEIEALFAHTVKLQKVYKILTGEECKENCISISGIQLKNMSESFHYKLSELKYVTHDPVLNNGCLAIAQNQNNSIGNNILYCYYNSLFDNEDGYYSWVLNFSGSDNLNELTTEQKKQIKFLMDYYKVYGYNMIRDLNRYDLSEAIIGYHTAIKSSDELFNEKLHFRIWLNPNFQNNVVAHMKSLGLSSQVMEYINTNLDLYIKQIYENIYGVDNGSKNNLNELILKGNKFMSGLVAGGVAFGFLLYVMTWLSDDKNGKVQTNINNDKSNSDNINEKDAELNFNNIQIIKDINNKFDELDQLVVSLKEFNINPNASLDLLRVSYDNEKTSIFKYYLTSVKVHGSDKEFLDSHEKYFIDILQSLDNEKSLLTDLFNKKMLEEANDNKLSVKLRKKVIEDNRM